MNKKPWLVCWGCIFNCVRPSYKWAMSDLDRSMYISLWVYVAHSLFIEGSHTSKNIASEHFCQNWEAIESATKIKVKIGMNLVTPKALQRWVCWTSKFDLSSTTKCNQTYICHSCEFGWNKSWIQAWNFVQQTHPKFVEPQISWTIVAQQSVANIIMNFLTPTVEAGSELFCSTNKP